MWQAYLDNEMNTPGKTEYYLAQLAAVFCQPYLPKGKRVSLKDFLNPVKFIRKGKETRAESLGRLNAVKAFWFASTGITKAKKKRKR